MKRHCFIILMLLITAGISTSAIAQKKKSEPAARSEVKFLEEISVEPDPLPATSSDPKAAFSKSLFTTTAKNNTNTSNTTSGTAIEGAHALQFKYALLLDTEVEQVLNISLFQMIDEWFGTRYRYGGTTKDGIDCSALMQTLYADAYGVSLPRTAREQFGFSKRISRAEIREGDLIFFNTIGGVSHVGMYLQNNKFLHASSGGGVTISDLYDEYWMRKFIGVGRVESALLTASLKP
ncbi:MAG: C40 family peptidase [Flavisolibacter sp.]